MGGVIFKAQAAKVKGEAITPQWLDVAAAEFYGVAPDFLNPGVQLKRLADLRGKLDHEVIGMPEVKDKLQRLAERALGDTMDPMRARYRMMICGPKDLAKSSIVKAFAEAMGLNLKVVDMAQFSVSVSPETVYKGGDRGNCTQKPLYRFPFENIEQAHPKMQEVVVDIMKAQAVPFSRNVKGKDDKPARKASYMDLTRASLFLTSTAGSDYILRVTKGAGFGFRPTSSSKITGTELTSWRRSRRMA